MAKSEFESRSLLQQLKLSDRLVGNTVSQSSVKKQRTFRDADETEVSTRNVGSDPSQGSDKLDDSQSHTTKFEYLLCAIPIDSDADRP